MSPSPTVLLDEQLFGLEVFLKDLGWKTVKVRAGRSDDEVLASAKGKRVRSSYKGCRLATRCRVQAVKVIEMGLEEEARLVNQMLTHFSSKER